MQNPRLFNLSAPLELESFAVQSFPVATEDAEATTYVTAVAGRPSCYNTNCGGLQKCNPDTEVCF